MKSLRWVVIAICAPCWAIAPATKEQIACAYDYVVEATVVAARRACTTVDGARNCIGDEEALQIDLRVDRLIARKAELRFAAGDADHAMAGRTLSGYVGRMPLSTADEAEWTGIFLRTLRESSSGAQPGADASDRLRSGLAAQRRERMRFVESRMQDRLVGYRFVFGLDFSKLRPGSFDATSWPIDEEPEIVELLKKGGGARCATPTDANAVEPNGGTTR